MKYDAIYFGKCLTEIRRDIIKRHGITYGKTGVLTFRHRAPLHRTDVSLLSRERFLYI